MKAAARKMRPSQYDPSTTGRGLTLTPRTLNFIPASSRLRPLRDQMIVAPADVVHSRILIVPPSGKPVRGKVLAIGPGHYPTQYDHRDKHKRTKSWAGMTFMPTEVKVGQIVHLGGMEIGGYSFEGMYWGDKYVIHCREQDVAGVEVP
jgi:hypothetical protein